MSLESLRYLIEGPQAFCRPNADPIDQYLYDHAEVAELDTLIAVYLVLRTFLLDPRLLCEYLFTIYTFVGTRKIVEVYMYSMLTA